MGEQLAPSGPVEVLTFPFSDRLLLINDLINGVIDRYEAARKGDWSQGRQVNAK